MHYSPESRCQHHVAQRIAKSDPYACTSFINGRECSLRTAYNQQVLCPFGKTADRLWSA